MIHEELQDLARELNARGVAYALVTVVRAVAPTSAYPGAQAIILADGTLHGWIGGGCATDVVVDAAQRAIGTGEPKLVRISNERIYAEEDVEQYRMSCASSGSIDLFIQPNSLASAVCILGRTPAADEARYLADRLRIRLTDSPNEAPVVLIATQGQGDAEALESALHSSARHVLMIASRRKADMLRGLMALRGIGAAQLARLEAPAGPNAGAKTPGEVALVAMAGVLAALRGQTAAHPAAELEAISTPGSFVNPVCGRAVDATHARHVERHGGVSYYFCCDGCWTTFLEDPEKYAAIQRMSAGSAEVPQTPA